ncbi:hypothetical protein D3C87_1048010 [compost metagenome]
MLVAHLHTRHQLPGAHVDRRKRRVEIGHGTAAGFLDAVDVEGQFAAFLLETRQVQMADAHAEARFEGHAADRHTVAQRHSQTAEVAMAVALGRAEAATEVAFTVVVEPAGAGVCIDKHPALQAIRRETCASGEERQVGVHFTSRPANAALAIAEAAIGAELFGKALGQAHHRPLAVFVAALRMGRTVGAEVARQGRTPQPILADLEVRAAAERRCGLIDQRTLAQQVAGSIGVHLTADGGLDAAERPGINRRLQVVVVIAVGARQAGVLQLLQQLRTGGSVADKAWLTGQAVVFDHLAAQHVDGFLGQTQTLLEVVVHAAVLRGHLVQAGLQITGVHAEQRRIDRRHARRHCRERRRHTRGGVVVGCQVVAHDRSAVDPGDAQQHGRGPAGAILAGGAMEQRGAVDPGQFVEQSVELAAHPRILDERAVGLLHHGEGLRGTGERDTRDVRAGGGGADDVDVAVGRAGQQRVRCGGDLARGAQVVDGLDAEAVENGQIRCGRGHRIGAVEHTGAHRAVIGRGVRGGGAGEITEVVHAFQARSVEWNRLGGMRGRDGQAQNRQRTQKTLKHDAASLIKRWAA